MKAQTHLRVHLGGALHLGLLVLAALAAVANFQH